MCEHLAGLRVSAALVCLGALAFAPRASAEDLVVSFAGPAHDQPPVTVSPEAVFENGPLDFRFEGLTFPAPAGGAAPSSVTLRDGSGAACSAELQPATGGNRRASFLAGAPTNCAAVFQRLFANRSPTVALELPAGTRRSRSPATPLSQTQHSIQVRLDPNAANYHEQIVINRADGTFRVLLDGAVRVILRNANATVVDSPVGADGRIENPGTILPALPANTGGLRVRVTTSDPSKRPDFGTAIVRDAPAGQGTPNDDDDWCRTEIRGAPDDYRICIDALPGGFRRHAFLAPRGVTSSRSVILPNHGVVVVVRHPPNSQATIAMNGTRGLTEPRTQVNVPAEGVAQAGGAMGATPSAVVSVRQFAPRRPGRADLDVSVTLGAEVRRMPPWELEVEEVYLGAIRLGIGSVFGAAVDQQWEARQRPGSEQHEVAQTANPAADFELVLGASVFLWDLLGPNGGRTYVIRRPWYAYVVPSPYAGISVLATRSTGVAALQSLHLGGEWEIARGFSVALTAVIRRGHELLPGLAVASPVPAGATVQTETTNVGWGLVINFSPDFFRFAAPVAGASEGTSD